MADSYPVDEKYVPTLEDLKKVWMKSQVVFASLPEKIEYDIGFDILIDSIREQARTELVAKQRVKA